MKVAQLGQIFQFHDLPKLVFPPVEVGELGHLPNAYHAFYLVLIYLRYNVLRFNMVRLGNLLPIYLSETMLF